MAIGKAISFATEKITELANASKIAEEKAAGFANSVNASIKNISSNASTLSSLNDEYKKLSEGVNALGENVSLSTDEYDRYKEIIQQVSDIMPNMTTYFNSQGEAIAFTKGKLSDLNDENERYIQNQAKKFLVNGDEDGNTLQDTLDNFGNNSKVAFWENIWNSIKNQFGSYDIDDLPVDTMISTFEDLQNKSKEEIAEYLSDIDMGAEAGYVQTESDRIKAITLDVLGVTVDEIKAMTNEEFNTLQQSIASNIESLKNNYDVDMSAITSGLIQSAYSKDSFWELGEELRNDVTTLLSSIDADAWKSLGITDQLQLETFVEKIIANISSNKNGFADAWNGLFELDKLKMNASDYISQVNSFIDTICNEIGIEGEDNRKQFKISLGFDTDVDQGMIDGLKKKLTDSSSKATAGMSKVISDSLQKENDKIATDWVDSLNTEEVELANSDAFVRALAEQEEKLNGAALSAEDYETALQSLKDTQEDLGDATLFSKAFSDSAGLEIDNIIAQFNAGKITPETIASFEVFHDVMRKTGQTAEEVYEDLEKFAEDFVSTDHMISNLEAMYTAMRDVKDEFKELGYISAGTLSAIAEKYPQLSSALTQYTSGLITEQDLIRQMEVLYQNDVEAYRVALTAKLQYDTTFFTNVKKHNQEFFAELAKAYNLDVQNWRSLAQAKADIDTQLIQNLAKTWSKYYNIILDAETGLYSAQSNQDLTGLSAEESVAAIVRGTEVRSQVNSINEVIKKLDSISSLEVEVPNFKNPTSKSTKGGSKGSKGSGNQTEIDWIARKLERLQKIIDLTKSKFENLFSIKSKSSSLKKQITQTTDLLNATIKAANKYKKYADSMKLFSDEKKNRAMKKLVQSGAYNISEYSSDMADKINQYKEYYDNYKEQLKQVEDLKKEIRELQIEEYQLKADYQQSRVDKLEAQSAVTTSTKKKNELENKRIKALKKQYEYEIKIAEAQGDTIKAKQLELELEAEIVASKKAKFDIISTKYENRANRKGYHLQDIENRVSLIEAKGSYVNADYYNRQYEEQESLAKMYAEEEARLQNRIKSIKKYSDEWYEALETIQDVQNKENDALITMQELADKVNDVAKSLDNLIINQFSTMISEADTLMTLLGDRLVDDDLGDFTNNGIAALGLIYAQMQAENEKGEQLRKQLAILEKQMDSYTDGETVTFIDANGMKRTISSLKELKDLEDETRNSIQESSKAEYTYYKNIIDLMKERYEAERDYLDDLISKKKELLDAEQDLHQYAKDIKEQTDSIASLQKQLAALSGDNSLEGKARRQKIEAQLQESKDTLAETEYDRLISDQKDMLDNLSAEYAEMLESYMKNDDALYKEGLAVIKENSAIISNVTTSVADKWGMELSGEMESVVGNINVVDSTLNGIRSDLQDYFASTQKENTATSSDTSNQLTAGDLASIRDNIANIRDTGSGHNGTDVLESKELNKMDGMTSKPLNLISNNPATKNNSGTGELVSMGSGKIATKFNNDQSLGKNEDGKEIIRVDNGNGEIMELVKVDVPPEWENFGRSIINSAMNTVPNLDAIKRQTIENAPTSIENNTSNVSIENVSFSLPNVSNYRELMQEAQADPKFEGMIGHMIDTKLTGSNRLNKFRTKF